MENQSTYRVRTNLGEDKPINIPVNLMQEYNSFEILSLKVNMDDTYRSYTATEGIVVGRVSTANNGLGIPNVRVSIFVPKGQYEQSDEEAVMYPFSSPTDLDGDRVRYNLLPSDSDVACYQVIGTLPTKRKILDNETVLEVFDKFYKYTTVTNEAGDYMLSNIPVGKQRIHIDADLSDIGPFLSQKPYDMIENLGFDKNKFESTRQFKSSADLDSLVQVISQNKSVYVYPYWGDITENSTEMKITRTDLSLNYEFKTSAIFIGSVITDKQSNSIRQNCTATEEAGKMADMVTGPGRIEMIRKTVDNKIEQYRVKGDQLINDNGVWCYQVPMNLDYVRTDEFGNVIPTDDPNKGVPTRARVRFRITLNEMASDNDAHKRCSYLVPNNPKTDDAKFLTEDDADYSFGSETWDESFVDLFMNKVYTVKNYIPQIQKSTRPTNRKHSGIKMTNHFGDNNPFPYNNMSIKLSFQYRLICVIVDIFIILVTALNAIISTIGLLPCELAKAFRKTPWPIKWLFRPLAKLIEKAIPNCIELSSEFCDDGVNKNVYYPGCFGCVWSLTNSDCAKEQKKIADKGDDAAVCTTGGEQLHTCVENELAQTNNATSFNFANDWVNGCLYMPLWYRKIRPKKSFFFGLFKRRAKDQWCAGEKGSGSQGSKIVTFCAVNYGENVPSETYSGDGINFRKMDGNNTGCGDNCHEVRFQYELNDGVIINKENMFGQKVWYYKSVETDVAVKSKLANEYLNSKGVAMVSKTLFATDIVMLGSMDDCDQNGIPKFFNYLRGSTYNMPSDILFSDTDISYSLDKDGNVIDQSAKKTSVAAGADWGNRNEWGYYDGGLFYSIGCSEIKVEPTSCINLKRICEIGVGLDEMQYVDNIDVDIKNDTDELDYNKGQLYYLRPDGFISYDDINDFDYRSMFATMNGNHLLTKINTETGVREYDFRHLYIDNFDGSLYRIMEKGQRDKKGRRSQHADANYKDNFHLEQTSVDYLTFRMGDNPYYYDGKSLVSDSENNNGPNSFRLPKYANSFYFYFGLKEGKTAIDLFNEEYNGPCVSKTEAKDNIPYEKNPSSWCYVDSDNNGTYDHSNYDGFLKINCENIQTPFSAILNSKNNSGVTYTFISKDKEGNISTSINAERVGFCGEGNAKVLDGYNQMYLLYENSALNHPLTHTDTNGKESDGAFCYIPSNGEYTLNIIDGEGNQHSFDISLKSSYLTFDDIEEPFAQPNNILEKYFKPQRIGNFSSPYISVAKAPLDPSDAIAVSADSAGFPDVKRKSISGKDSALKIRSEEEIKLNGTICLYNVYYDDEKLDTFTIEVKCADDDDEDLNGWYEYGEVKALFDHTPKSPTNPNPKYVNNLFNYNNDIVNVHEGKTSPYFYYYDNLDINGSKIRCYVLRCPKGGVNYNVRITQVCNVNGVYKKTQNVVERLVFVGEPTPYKLLINGADYDIIKNFKTGWELKSGVKIQTEGEKLDYKHSPFVGIGDITNIKGWLNISDVNNPNYLWDEEKDIYGTSAMKYSKLKEGDEITLRKISLADGKYVETTKKYNIVEGDSYIDRYKDEVELEIIQNAEPEEPKKSEYDDENKFNEIYGKWDIVHKEWVDEVNNTYDKVQPLLNRLDFIDTMKNAFWVQDEEEEKTLIYTVQTDDNPFDVWTLYNAEEVSQSDEDYNECESEQKNDKREGWIYTNKSETVINGIKIPNITSYDSKLFGISEDSTRINKLRGTYGTFIINENGNEVIQKGKPNGIAFAQDNIAENSKDSGSISIKPPYIVACVNNEGKTKPENLVVKNFYGTETNKFGINTFKFGESNDNNGYIKDRQNHQFFQFYLIDKIFSPDIVTWSYINNIPYYIPWLPYDAKPEDYEEKSLKNAASKLGEVIKTYGILSGNIKNGITSYSNTLEDFESKNIFDNDAVVKTYKNDTEDSIPTRRCILYGDVKDVDNLTYRNYRHVKDEIIETNQYRNVPNREGELEFVDKNSSAKTSRNLYGGMRVTLRSTTLNACDSSFYSANDDSSLSLKVNVTNGDSNKPITYYIFEVDKNGLYEQSKRRVYYPLNAFDFTIDKNDNEKKNFYIECNNRIENWAWKIKNTSDNNVTLAPQFFNKNTLEKHFVDKNDTNSADNLAQVNITSQIEREDSEGETVYENKPGYGNTGVFTELEHRPYFVVAVTENNCRAVSPVYDFTRVYYGMMLVNVGNGQKALRVWLEDVIDENSKRPNNYYLTQFDFTISYVIGNGETNITSGDVPYPYSSVDIKKTYDNVDDANKDKEKFFDKLKIDESISYKSQDATESETAKYVIRTKTGGSINAKTDTITEDKYRETELPKTYWYETQIINEVNGETEDRWATITISENGEIGNDVKGSDVKPGEDDVMFSESSSPLYYKKEDTKDIKNEKGEVIGQETVIEYYEITLTKTNYVEETVDYDPSVPYFKRYYDKVLTKDQENTISSMIKLYSNNSFVFRRYKNVVNNLIKFYVTDYVGLKHRATLKTVR